MPMRPSSSPRAASGKSVWTSGIGIRPPIVGRPEPRPTPDETAAGERVEALDHLIARSQRIGERVDPDVDPVADVIEQVRHQQAAEDEQRQPDDDEADPRRRHINEGEEHREEQQGRAEVTLDHDDPEGDRPHDDHRGEIRQRRQAERPEPRVLLHEQRPVLRQVARKEDDQDDLEELGRLAGEGTDGEGQALAVHLGAQDEREQQQADAGGGPRVLVPAQPAVRADDDPDDRRDRTPRTSQTSWTWARPTSAPNQCCVTRPCGSRCMRRREIPPSMPTTGNRIWSVRRPARTNAACPASKAPR